MPKIDVLFLPNNSGLGHLLRSYSIAKTLSGEGFNIKLAYSGKYENLIDEKIRINGTTSDFNQKYYTLDTLKALAYLMDYKRLKQIVNNEVSLLEKIHPKIIVGDTRFTLKISADILNIKYFSLLNANMSPYYQKIPEQFVDFCKRSVEPYNSLVKDKNLDFTVNSFFDICMADLNLFCDLEDFFPTCDAPKDKCTYIGPILCSVGEALKAHNKIKELKEKNKPLIYLTLGGTGDLKLIESFDALAETNKLSFVFSSAKRTMQKNANISFVDFIPSGALSYFDLCINQGGNGTIYQCINHKLPMICIPTNSDQIDNARRVEELGIGHGMIAQYAVPDTLANSIAFLIESKEVKSNLSNLSRKIKKTNAVKKACEIIKGHL